MFGVQLIEAAATELHSGNKSEASHAEFHSFPSFQVGAEQQELEYGKDYPLQGKPSPDINSRRPTHPSSRQTSVGEDQRFWSVSGIFKNFFFFFPGMLT